MINLFSIAYDDYSIKYLQRIFGTMNGLLTTEVSKGDAGGISFLPGMFEVFNATVLAIGALIIVYFTIMGVVKTAHEGEMMGKQWSSLWIPLRMVMGIAALVPTPATGGYSTIQVVMMWVIMQGVGAADVLWNTVLDQVSVLGSMLGDPPIPSTRASQSIPNLYSALVCQASYKESLPNPTGSKSSGAYYCAGSGAAFCREEQTFDPADENKTSYQMGPQGACGTLNYCDQKAACSGGDGGTANEGSLACRACKKQREVLDQLINGAMGTYARQFVQTDYSYRNFYVNNNPSAGADFNSDWINKYCTDKNIADCCVPGTVSGDNVCKASTNAFSGFPTDSGGNPMNPSSQAVEGLYWPYSLSGLSDNTDFVRTSIDLYMQELTLSVREYMNQERDKIRGSETSPFFEYARGTGWIMAGSLFYLISQKNNTNLEAANPALHVDPPSNKNITSGALPPEGETIYRNNYLAAKTLISVMESSAQVTSATGRAQKKIDDGGTGVGDVTDWFDQLILEIADGFITAISGGSGENVNPLVSMQQSGYTFIFIASVAYGVLLLALVIVGAFGGITPMVLGTGSSTGPVQTALILMWTLLLPAILGVLGILVSVGGLIGIYVPLIPYMIFTMGAVGWFLSVIEAMVAGPLVALGILSPGGQSEILGKAEPALMLLFNIFLRPTLMIFGLVAALFLASVVVDLINQGFLLVVTSIANTSFVAGGGGSDITFRDGKPYLAVGARALGANPVMLIMVLVTYTFFIVSVMNKCFSAIHIIPEKVTRWIGSQGEQYGEGEAVREGKQGVEAGGQGVKGGVQAAKGSAQDTSQRASQGRDRMRAKAKRDAKKKDTGAGAEGDGS